MIACELPWREPDDVFLSCFSGAENAFWLEGGDRSYCGYAKEAIDYIPHSGEWVGFIEFAASLDSADIRLMRVASGFAFDRRTRRMFRFGEEQRPLSRQLGSVPSPHLRFVRSREAYLQDIRRCQELIREGESYEICLTNKLRATADVDALAYYLRLRQPHPAPYSAYLQFGDLRIASSSPEQFLQVTSEGYVQARPIKGTASRDTDPQLLANDPKSRAEHLMIVDLLRNDLGRVCAVDTVEVPELMKIETHGGVHQMVSTVRGRLRPDRTALDALRSAFPGGSMTGAPKKRTLEILNALETEPRGIYSGAIGYIGDSGEMNWNMVIRTAVFEGREISIGTGGAIVAQSDPASEWNEIVLKAQHLVEAFDGMIV